MQLEPTVLWDTVGELTKVRHYKLSKYVVKMVL